LQTSNYLFAECPCLLSFDQLYRLHSSHSLTVTKTEKWKETSLDKTASHTSFWSSLLCCRGVLAHWRQTPLPPALFRRHKSHLLR
jgi:hypothetical protein